jgi:hypothetical protein
LEQVALVQNGRLGPAPVHQPARAFRERQREPQSESDVFLQLFTALVVVWETCIDSLHQVVEFVVTLPHSQVWGVLSLPCASSAAPLKGFA